MSMLQYDGTERVTPFRGLRGGLRRSRLSLALGAVVFAIACLSSSRSAAAQVVPDSLIGRVTQRIVSRSDSLRSYALYVPSNYNPSRTWPVIFAMDPRGRALIPLERLRPAAERFGWIIMSSYDTRSDDPNAPNVEAANAMLDDAQTGFRVNTRRFYFAGFSGTARVSWLFAARIGEPVAGIIGAGADTHTQNQWLVTPSAPRVAFFGAAGVLDFNWDEVKAMEPWLDQGGYAWRTRYFQGSHGWPPDSLFTEAVTWLQLQAMRAGRAPMDSALVDSLYQSAMRQAAEIEATNVVEAHSRYREVVRDFRGLRDSTAAFAMVAELGSRREVMRAAEQTRQILRTESEYSVHLGTMIAKQRDRSRPSSVNDIVKDLRISALQRSARDSSDIELARSAQRMLELAYVNAYFYAPGDFLSHKQNGHALAMLDVADRIYPGRPGTEYQRARVLTQAGKRDDAIKALQRAVAAGINPAAFDADPVLAPLREMPGYRELLRR